MSKKDQIHTIFDSMAEVLFSIKFGHIEAFKKLGLGRQQFWALKMIAHHDGPISVKDLSQKLNITSGAVSQLIDPLVEKRLVERTEDAADRRIVRLELTKKARETFKTLRKAHLENIKSMFDDLSEGDLQTLENLLKKISVQHVDCGWDHRQENKKDSTHSANH